MGGNSRAMRSFASTGDPHRARTVSQSGPASTRSNGWWPGSNARAGGIGMRFAKGFVGGVAAASLVLGLAGAAAAEGKGPGTCGPPGASVTKGGMGISDLREGCRSSGPNRGLRLQESWGVCPPGLLLGKRDSDLPRGAAVRTSLCRAAAPRRVRIIDMTPRGSRLIIGDIVRSMRSGPGALTMFTTPHRSAVFRSQRISLIEDLSPVVDPVCTG